MTQSLTSARSSRVRTSRQAVATGAIVAMLVGAAVGALGTIAEAAPAQAEETATSSQVTLTNAQNALNPEGAPFPNLEVTISQTKDLVSQGIEVRYTGLARSVQPSGNHGGENFLQIAQCWGEDPENPGHPDRRTCQYGGTGDWGALRDGNTQPQHVAAQDAMYTAPPRAGVAHSYTAIPFVAFNSERIVDPAAAPADRVISTLGHDDAGNLISIASPTLSLSTNEFYTKFTTNEVKWAPAGPEGTGTVPFEVQTAMQSPALGCGNPIVAADGSATGESCWLVIIPRGTGDSGSPTTGMPGIWWDAWEHHLAVKLDFKPLGVRCAIGSSEQQVAGSQLLSQAIASWQPRLCSGEDGAAFVHTIGSEADALMAASRTTPSPLAFASLPLDVAAAGLESDPLVYAPVALSGISISFAIDSQPSSSAPAEFQQRARMQLTDLNLTPRLLAKLLTSSYVDALPRGSDKSHIGWTVQNAGKNARNLTRDPDFLQHNGGTEGEWARQSIIGAAVSDIMAPDGRSDLARQLWSYVLADAEAAAWLAGEADEWGMVVNPYYSTNAELNPTGVAFSLPRENFPKADPVEKPDQTNPADPANYNPSSGTGAINLVTWRPYTHGFENGAYLTLRGDGQELGDWDPLSRPPKFGKSVRDLFGSRKTIALSTAPAAYQYQTVTAKLRNPAGQFVTANATGFTAAAAAMTPNAAQPEVLGFDPTSAAAKAAPTAYPLTMPVYAALNPAQSDAELRASYARLIRYAAGLGQVPGTELGQLPPGYATIPASWREQAAAAADAIAAAIPVNRPPATQPTVSPSTTYTSPTTTVTPPATTAATETAAETAAQVGVATSRPTPDDPEIGPLAAAVPAGLTAGLAAALAVPLVGRIRRRT